MELKALTIAEMKSKKDDADDPKLAGLFCEKCCVVLATHLIGDAEIPMCCECVECIGSDSVKLHMSHKSLWKENIENYWLKRLQREKEGG